LQDELRQEKYSILNDPMLPPLRWELLPADVDLKTKPGKKDVSFSTIIEVLRALGQLQSLELMIPEQGPHPSQLASLGKVRERASRKKKTKPENYSGWKWGDEK